MKSMQLALPTALLVCALLVVPATGWTQSSYDVSKSSATTTSTTKETEKKDKGAVDKIIAKCKQWVHKIDKKGVIRQTGTCSVRG